MSESEKQIGAEVSKGWIKAVKFGGGAMMLIVCGALWLAFFFLQAKNDERYLTRSELIAHQKSELEMMNVRKEYEERIQKQAEDNKAETLANIRQSVSLVQAQCDKIEKKLEALLQEIKSRD
jgi:hypothetical protein